MVSRQQRSVIVAHPRRVGKTAAANFHRLLEERGIFSERSPFWQMVLNRLEQRLSDPDSNITLDDVLVEARQVLKEVEETHEKEVRRRT